VVVDEKRGACHPQWGEKKNFRPHSGGSNTLSILEKAERKKKRMIRKEGERGGKNRESVDASP